MVRTIPEVASCCALNNWGSCLHNLQTVGYRKLHGLPLCECTPLRIDEEPDGSGLSQLARILIHPTC